MIKLVCDKCNKESTGIKVWDKVTPPLVVCPNCYKRLKAEKKFNNQDKARQIYVKPKVIIKDNRMCRRYSIKRNNSIVFKVEFYENGERLYYKIYRVVRTADIIIKKFLNKEEFTEMEKKGMIVKYGRRMSEKALKNKYDYIHKYDKENSRKFTIQLNKVKDSELIEAFDSSKSKAQMVRDMYEVYKKGL